MLLAGLLGALDDNLTSAIVTALRAYPVVNHGSTAIRAGSKGRDGGEIVGAALVPALL